MKIERLQIEKKNAQTVAVIRKKLRGAGTALQIEVSRSLGGLIFLDFKNVFKELVVAYLLVLHLKTETARKFGELMLDHLNLPDAEREESGIGSFNVSEFTGIDIEFDKGDQSENRPDWYVLKYPVGAVYKEIKILPNAFRELGVVLSQL